MSKTLKEAGVWCLPRPSSETALIPAANGVFFRVHASLPFKIGSPLWQLNPCDLARRSLNLLALELLFLKPTRHLSTCFLDGGMGSLFP